MKHDNRLDWIGYGLVLALCLFWGGVELFGPCSWLGPSPSPPRALLLAPSFDLPEKPRIVF